MQNNFSNHKYWIIAGSAIIGLILMLYPFATYDSLSMKITRPEAIKFAKEFLKEQKINTEGFSEEAFLDNSPIETRYILKKLGGKEFKNYGKNEKWSNLSWMVFIHQNLAKQIEQTSYWVDVSQDGKIFGFKSTIPESESLPSLNKTEATNLISDFLYKKIGNEFNQYKLIESKEEILRSRTDHSFRWEKEESKLNAKIVITGRVNGNTIGSYQHYFEVPQNDREYFEASEAIYGTISVVFVVFLIFLALYLFLKKYHQGEVWVSVGRTLFLIYFFLTLINLADYWPGMGLGTSIGNLSFMNVKIIMVLVNGLVLSFFMALLIFASWAVGESYARSLWPNKLKGVDAFIKGHFFTFDSGVSLMKGFVLGSALALSFMIAGIIINQPNAKIFLSPTGLLESFNSYIPSLAVLLDSATTALLASITITFFIVNISYQRWKKKWISILLSGIITTLAFVIASTPPSLNNFSINILSGFLFGCGIAYIYFLFDLLTVISLHFTALLISKAYLLYPANGTYYEINFIAVILIILVIPFLYVISMIRKEEFVLENYGLPSHIARISEREKYKREMEIAAKVQLSLLPKEEPRIPGYDISGLSLPAIEAGGDYFDFVKLSGNKIGIAIGDVSGKGVGAAIYMTLTKGILQAHAEENVSPSNVLSKVNRLLYKTIEKNSFVSMFYAILDFSTNKLLYSRAGHNPGILCSENSGSTKLLMSKGMALGLEEGTKFTSTLNEETIGLNKGDFVVFYTDGFTEAMNEKQEQYGEQKLIQIIKDNKDKSSRELINLILKDVKKFVDNYPQHDDMTIVVVKRI